MSALGEAPILEIKLDDEVLKNVTAESMDEVPMTIKISLEENKRVSLKLRLLNDYWNAETGEDRNIFLKSFALKKETKKIE